MSKRLKFRLPAYCPLEHCSLSVSSLDSLRVCVKELEDEFRSTLEVNKQLCSTHNDLTHTSYANFYQIGLTDTAVENDLITFEQLDKFNADIKTSGGNSYRLKMELSTDESSPMNERTFVQKTETYNRYKELFDTVLSKFKGTPTRIRLVKLKAGGSITPHIDYDPSYSVRVIIPVITNDDCVNLFWVKNQIQAVSFSAGTAYFLNTGYKHAVANYGTTDRYTLMISLSTASDVQHIMS